MCVCVSKRVRSLQRPPLHAQRWKSSRLVGPREWTQWVVLHSPATCTFRLAYWWRPCAPTSFKVGRSIHFVKGKRHEQIKSAVDPPDRHSFEWAGPLSGRRMIRSAQRRTYHSDSGDWGGGERKTWKSQRQSQELLRPEPFAVWDGFVGFRAVFSLQI